MRTVLLLFASNVFMNVAWYWHLKVANGRMALAAIIAISWLLALPEYCLAVPANRLLRRRERIMATDEHG